MSSPLLRTSGLTKCYGAIAVLHEVDFDLKSGEIHGLLGANGAGKSTLCRIVSGLIPSTSGSMQIRGENYRPVNKQDAERHGVGIVQQELNLVRTLSVAENLQLPHLPTFAGIIRQRELYRRARRILDRYGLPDVAPETPVGRLGIGRQQMVEIAAALAHKCQILILDEPTAALTNAETERLFGWLDELRQQGVGIIYISHRLAEVTKLSDRITVLRDGKHVCTRLTAELTTPQMVDLVSGPASGASSESIYQSFTSKEDIVLRVDGLASGIVQDVSFDLRRGERLGLAGLVGAGRTELLRAIFGADVATSGGVALGKKRASGRFRSPSQAVSAGLAMVTEDRQRDGLLLTQSVRVNTTLSALADQFAAAGVIRSELEQQRTTQQCESMETRCTDMEQMVRTLSGGNQQKVAIAKWLVRDADVFLFDEPTRGIDVAARKRIYDLFATLASAGKGLIIASSDLQELLANCDRIAVMSAGHLEAIFDRDTWSEDAIMRAAFSRYLQPQVA